MPLNRTKSYASLLFVRHGLVPALSAILFFASGCTAGPDFVRPGPPVVTSYNYGSDPASTIFADGRIQRFTPGDSISAAWWKAFDSQQVDAIVKDAFENNQGLQAAQARLRQSRENLLAGHGIFYPQFDAAFGVMRQKSSLQGNGIGGPENIFSLYTLSSSVSYALDIFGSRRRAVEGLEAGVDYQNAVLSATYLALEGNIVNTMIAKAGYFDQIRATEQMIGFLKEQAVLAEVQELSGIVPHAKVLNIRAQLFSVEAALPSLRQRLSQADHLLAALTGHFPAEVGPSEVSLAAFRLPESIPLVVPSELVRRRPDIFAAEAQLHAAGAELGVATAALFPRFTLSAAFDRAGSSLSGLFSGPLNSWGIGAELAAPLFHGGTLIHQKQAAVEGYAQALAEYRQTVVSAFAEVADSLRAVEYDAEVLSAQTLTLEASEEALRHVTANFEAGVADYSQVLITDIQYQQAKIGHLQARARRLQDSVALFVALGGGWQMRELQGKAGE
ncbi:MAG: efflux transporter outer membrane subunit [Nitrospirae bacterium]|nr:efflux transporter outer membrane subunit [Nitrospirota bacterium]